MSLHLSASTLFNEEIDAFVNELNEHPQLDQREIREALQNIKISKKILTLMSKPAEKTKTWTQYRELLVSQQRIAEGCRFINVNKKTLLEAEKKYGVSSSIIAGIIGVETSYGKIKGNHNVFTALSTLAFRYPKNNSKRKKFFRYQLKEFLLMANSQRVNFNDYKGSYAGALGIPQFMPDNYRRLAVDFNRDGKIDIIGNVEDAIGSIGNFLRFHGWIPDQEVFFAIPKAHHVRASNIKYNPSATNTTLNELIPDWQKIERLLKMEKGKFTPVSLLKLDEGGKKKQWLGFENFFTLFHYNPRLFYALAVASLARELNQCETATQ